MPRRTLALPWLLFLSLGCASPPPRTALLAADSALAHAVETAGAAQAFPKYLAEDAVYLEPDAEHMQGKDRIAAFLTAHPSDGTLRLRPARAEVSGDGAVGYVVGWTELTQPDNPVRHGKYIAFWRQQPDRTWRLEAWNRSRCAEGPPAALPALADPASSGGARVDPLEGTRALMEADSAFAAASIARGAAQAFSTYAAPTAVSLGGGKDFVVGPEAIGREQDGPPGQVLDWKPVLAGVGPTGDLGWTVGTFAFTPPGAPNPIVGKYLTVWRRADQGAWRFVADGGSGNAAPPGRH